MQFNKTDQVPSTKYKHNVEWFNTTWDPQLLESSNQLSYILGCSLNPLSWIPHGVLTKDLSILSLEGS